MTDFIHRLKRLRDRLTRPGGSLGLLARHEIYPRGIVHVGANDGREFRRYRRSPACHALYVEPNPEAFAELKQRLRGRPGHYPFQALCSDTDGEEVEFNVASNSGYSSSMFALGRHATLYPGITYVRSVPMKTRTLDSILSGDPYCDLVFDFMVLDVQGAELKVLGGARDRLAQFRAIYTEVSEEPLYEGGCTLDQIIAFLEPFGFRMKHLDINPDTWGDALFIRAH